MSDTTHALEIFEAASREYFAHRRAEAPDVGPLLDSIEYSFFNGGKRFRPQLCYATAEALGVPSEKITPFAMAVEAIHTYSLIHDDLPCMDDDKERRGQPTNHIQFSEDMALLAGDSLLTEAFSMLSQSDAPENIQLVSLVARGAGLLGMIRGQVLDLGKGQPVESLSDLIHLHELKTGQLISLCFMGPALLARQPLEPFRDLGLLLGLAFQVKDDLLDVDEEDQMSFIPFLGAEGTQQHLQMLTEKLQTRLVELNLHQSSLKDLIEFNFSRAQ